METPISTEEKIDYIYTQLKKQEKTATFKLVSRWGFRIGIILYIVYIYKVALPAFTNDMFEKMTPNFEDSQTIENIKQYIDNTF